MKHLLFVFGLLFFATWEINAQDNNVDDDLYQHAIEYLEEHNLITTEDIVLISEQSGAGIESYEFKYAIVMLQGMLEFTPIGEGNGLPDHIEASILNCLKRAVGVEDAQAIYNSLAGQRVTRRVFVKAAVKAIKVIGKRVAGPIGVAVTVGEFLWCLKG